MGLRAIHELEAVADDLDAQAEELERHAAWKRGDAEAERDALLLCVEAGQVRRDARRVGR